MSTNTVVSSTTDSVKLVTVAASQDASATISAAVDNANALSIENAIIRTLVKDTDFTDETFTATEFNEFTEHTVVNQDIFASQVHAIHSVYDNANALNVSQDVSLGQQAMNAIVIDSTSNTLAPGSLAIKIEADISNDTYPLKNDDNVENHTITLSGNNVGVIKTALSSSHTISAELGLLSLSEDPSNNVNIIVSDASFSGFLEFSIKENSDVTVDNENYGDYAFKINTSESKKFSYTVGDANVDGLYDLSDGAGIAPSGSLNGLTAALANGTGKYSELALPADLSAIEAFETGLNVTLPGSIVGDANVATLFDVNDSTLLRNVEFMKALQQNNKNNTSGPDSTSMSVKVTNGTSGLSNGDIVDSESLYSAQTPSDNTGNTQFVISLAKEQNEMLTDGTVTGQVDLNKTAAADRLPYGGDVAGLLSNTRVLYNGETPDISLGVVDLETCNTKTVKYEIKSVLPKPIVSDFADALLNNGTASITDASAIVFKKIADNTIANTAVDVSFVDLSGLLSAEDNVLLLSIQNQNRFASRTRKVFDKDDVSMSSQDFSIEVTGTHVDMNDVSGIFTDVRLYLEPKSLMDLSENGLDISGAAHTISNSSEGADNTTPIVLGVVMDSKFDIDGVFGTIVAGSGASSMLIDVSSMSSNHTGPLGTKVDMTIGDTTKVIYDDELTKSVAVDVSLVQLSSDAATHAGKEVRKMESTRTVDIEVDLELGVYKNLKLKMLGVTETDIYYELWDTSDPNGIVYQLPDSKLFQLNDVYKTKNRTISGTNTVTLALNANMMKSLNVQLQGSTDSGSSWEVTEDVYSADAFYGKTTTITGFNDSDNSNIPDSVFTVELDSNVVLDKESYYIDLDYSRGNQTFTITGKTLTGVEISEHVDQVQELLVNSQGLFGLFDSDIGTSTNSSDFGGVLSTVLQNGDTGSSLRIKRGGDVDASDVMILETSDSFRADFMLLISRANIMVVKKTLDGYFDEPYALHGHYPLFSTQALSDSASSNNSSTTIKLDNVVHYKPNAPTDFTANDGLFTGPFFVSDNQGSDSATVHGGYYPSFSTEAASTEAVADAYGTVRAEIVINKTITLDTSSVEVTMEGVSVEEVAGKPFAVAGWYPLYMEEHRDRQPYTFNGVQYWLDNSGADGTDFFTGNFTGDKHHVYRNTAGEHWWPVVNGGSLVADGSSVDVVVANTYWNVQTQAEDILSDIDTSTNFIGDNENALTFRGEEKLYFDESLAAVDSTEKLAHRIILDGPDHFKAEVSYIAAGVSTDDVLLKNTSEFGFHYPVYNSNADVSELSGNDYKSVDFVRLYWNGAVDAVELDKDIITTIESLKIGSMPNNERRYFGTYEQLVGINIDGTYPLFQTEADANNYSDNADVEISFNVLDSFEYSYVMPGKFATTYSMSGETVVVDSEKNDVRKYGDYVPSVGGLDVQPFAYGGHYPLFTSSDDVQSYYGSQVSVTQDNGILPEVSGVRPSVFYKADVKVNNYAGPISVNGYYPLYDKSVTLSQTAPANGDDFATKGELVYEAAITQSTEVTFVEKFNAQSQTFSKPVFKPELVNGLPVSSIGTKMFEGTYPDTSPFAVGGYYPVYKTLPLQGSGSYEVTYNGNTKYMPTEVPTLNNEYGDDVNYALQYTTSRQNDMWPLYTSATDASGANKTTTQELTTYTYELTAVEIGSFKVDVSDTNFTDISTIDIDTLAGGPIDILGYYPLYTTQADAESVSTMRTKKSTTHKFFDKTFYMPTYQKWETSPRKLGNNGNSVFTNGVRTVSITRSLHYPAVPVAQVTHYHKTSANMGVDVNGPFTYGGYFPLFTDASDNRQPVVINNETFYHAHLAAGATTTYADAYVFNKKWPVLGTLLDAKFVTEQEQIDISGLTFEVLNDTLTFFRPNEGQYFLAEKSDQKVFEANGDAIKFENGVELTFQNVQSYNTKGSTFLAQDKISVLHSTTSGSPIMEAINRLTYSSAVAQDVITSGYRGVIADEKFNINRTQTTYKVTMSLSDASNSTVDSVDVNMSYNTATSVSLSNVTNGTFDVAFGNAGAPNDTGIKLTPKFSLIGANDLVTEGNLVITPAQYAVTETVVDGGNISYQLEGRSTDLQIQINRMDVMVTRLINYNPTSFDRFIYHAHSRTGNDLSQETDASLNALGYNAMHLLVDRINTGSQPTFGTGVGVPSIDVTYNGVDLNYAMPNTGGTQDISFGNVTTLVFKRVGGTLALDENNVVTVSKPNMEYAIRELTSDVSVNGVYEGVDISSSTFIVSDNNVTLRAGVETTLSVRSLYDYHTAPDANVYKLDMTNHPNKAIVTIDYTGDISDSDVYSGPLNVNGETVKTFVQNQSVISTLTGLGNLQISGAGVGDVNFRLPHAFMNTGDYSLALEVFNGVKTSLYGAHYDVDGSAPVVVVRKYTGEARKPFDDFSIDAGLTRSVDFKVTSVKERRISLKAPDSLGQTPYQFSSILASTALDISAGAVSDWSDVALNDVDNSSNVMNGDKLEYVLVPLSLPGVGNILEVLSPDETTLSKTLIIHQPDITRVISKDGAPVFRLRNNGRIDTPQLTSHAVNLVASQQNKSTTILGEMLSYNVLHGSNL